MKEEKKSEVCCDDNSVIKRNICNRGGGGSNAIYGLGVVGALFYFLQGATTFNVIMMGIGKAVFWPAILMFKLLTYLQM